MTEEIKELMFAAAKLNAAIATVLQKEIEVELDVTTVQHGDRYCPIVLIGVLPSYSINVEVR